MKVKCHEDATELVFYIKLYSLCLPMYMCRPIRYHTRLLHLRDIYKYINEKLYVVYSVIYGCMYAVQHPQVYTKERHTIGMLLQDRAFLLCANNYT